MDMNRSGQFILHCLCVCNNLLLSSVGMYFSAVACKAQSHKHNELHSFNLTCAIVSLSQLIMSVQASLFPVLKYCTAAMQVMQTLIGSGSSTARMRQLAQAEVDWTSFRSAVELYHTALTDTHDGHAAGSMHLPKLTARSSHGSIAGCSPRTANAADLSPRSCYSFCSPRSPREQVRPYTAPTVVSRQPFHTGSECPFYVSSLYKNNQQAKSRAQSPTLLNSAQSVQSMAEQGSFLSSPAHCSPAAPQPFLKASSGGVALTFGSRERDRPHSGSTQPPADAKKNSSKESHSPSELITVMRKGGPLSEKPKALSRIVARSKAWPASSDRHPAGSGLTVRQQACFLGKSSLAKHEEKLAEKYGPWLQDLRSVKSCSPADAQRLTAYLQADVVETSADDALAPSLYSMGPV